MSLGKFLCSFIGGRLSIILLKTSVSFIHKTGCPDVNDGFVKFSDLSDTESKIEEKETPSRRIHSENLEDENE